MSRRLWLALDEGELMLRVGSLTWKPKIAYGVCVRCAGYQMLRLSGLCYDCLPGKQWGRYLTEPWEEVVYYCTRGRPGLIKIGTSTYVHTRVRNLGAQLLATEPGGASVEHARQREFSAWSAADEAYRRGFRCESEWFYPVPELLAHIKTLRKPHQRASHRG